MLMPASSEFIALCQSQVALLTNGLGAALSIVYLTEELTEVSDAKLVPIAAYPEEVAEWQEEQIFTLLFQRQYRETPKPRLLASDSARETPTVLSPMPMQPQDGKTMHPSQAAEQALLRQQQIVLPLMYQDVVMGLLVTARADRAWKEAEQTQIEKIAESIAIACILDQRAQWLTHDLRQQRLLREQKHDLFDDLLHQFRNPLTALKTFGKLLVKRLKPGDANRSVAEGIVRESDRLQELLQQFNAAIDLDEAAFRRLLTAIDETDGEADQQDQDTLDQVLGIDVGIDIAPPALPHAAPPLLPSSNLLGGSSSQLAPQLLASVLTPLLDSAEAIAQDRQLTLITDIPPNLPPVKISDRALREVLNNLIDNALKYTPSGGIVYIRVYSSPVIERNHQQAVVIADTGPGIPTQDLAHLFERHYRGVQAETDIPGTGLGLAIARELLHQMQGEIQIFSPVFASGLPPEFATDLERELGRPTHSGTTVVVWLMEAEV